MMQIKLSQLEMSMVKNIWLANQKKYGFKHKYNADPEKMMRIGMDGFGAEIALVKYLGITDHTPNIAGSEQPDVGPFDVRQTQYPYGKLIIYPADKDERITVLVTGRESVYYIRGWIKNKDAKQQKYYGSLKRKNSPCFIVPQTNLNSMDTIPWNTN